jgi:hypothetical protein
VGGWVGGWKAVTVTIDAGRRKIQVSYYNVVPWHVLVSLHISTRPCVSLFVACAWGDVVPQDKTGRWSTAGIADLLRQRMQWAQDTLQANGYKTKVAEDGGWPCVQGRHIIELLCFVMWRPLPRVGTPAMRSEIHHD